MPLISSKKEYRKELWEIQGLLYIIASNFIVYRWHIAGEIFFWYGLFTLICSLVMFGKLKKESK